LSPYNILDFPRESISQETEMSHSGFAYSAPVARFHVPKHRKISARAPMRTH